MFHDERQRDLKDLSCLFNSNLPTPSSWHLICAGAIHTSLGERLRHTREKGILSLERADCAMLWSYALVIAGVAAVPLKVEAAPTAPALAPARSSRFLNGTSRNNEIPIPSRECGTAPPSARLREAHAALRKQKLLRRASPSASKYTVDTYFHVVSTHQSSHMVTKDMIANQFGALQAAYAPSNISFHLVATDYTINDTWATDQNDGNMKVALRRGNYSALNVYFQTNLSTVAAGTSTQLLGYCTLPTNISYSPCSDCPLAAEPAADYFRDGCNVLAGSMPNGRVVGYNQGKTAVHEVGHWFGLLHTFQDTSCATDDPGDYIDDTPQESVSTDGCPVGKKSCPDCPGDDPIHNFMDYSTDAW